MIKEFSRPDFASGSIEFQSHGEEVCIYANDEGLRRLISMCSRLLEKGIEDHVHLEDFELLTTKSLKGVIARIDAKKIVDSSTSCY